MLQEYNRQDVLEGACRTPKALDPSKSKVKPPSDLSKPSGAEVQRRRETVAPTTLRNRGECSSMRALWQVDLQPIANHHQSRPSRIELEQHHVAVLDDVFLAFVARLAGFLGGHFAAERHEIVIGDGLGADEAALEIGVDDAGRLRRLGALVRRSRRASPSARR